MIIIETTYGRWTFLGKDEKRKYSFICKCVCGTERSVMSKSLRGGTSTNCGCVRTEKFRNQLITHGKSGTKLNRVWRNMKDRCNNKSHKSYKNYGGRGIRVCKEWDNFDVFEQWAIENGYKEGLTIDRKDVNGNYGPSNCSWEGWLEQSRNKRNSHFITKDGQTKTISEWAEEIGIKQATIQGRIRKGWKEEDLLSPKLPKTRNKNNRFITINEETKTIAEWVIYSGINRATFRYRIKKGWKEEDLLKPI